MAAGEPAAAAELLREALAEWRGPALSDLMEQGLDWPEVAGLRQLRLDAMEYRFEAELACGRHHTVLGELNSLAEAEPLRERLSGQLMLALYRCGRQAEALDVFSRVRRALVEEHGLEPSRDLQALQRRILHHDQELTSPVEEVPASVRLLHGAAATGPSSAGRPAAAAPPAPPLLTVAGQRPERAAAEAPAAARTPHPAPAQARGGPVLGRRREVCVLLVRVRARTGGGAAVPEQLDVPLNEAAASLAEIVEAHEGTIVGSLGYLTAALFGLRDDWAAAPLEAVRAAFAMRDSVGGLPGLGIEAVVTMGRALVREDSAGRSPWWGRSWTPPSTCCRTCRRARCTSARRWPPAPRGGSATARSPGVPTRPPRCVRHARCTPGRSRCAAARPMPGSTNWPSSAAISTTPATTTRPIW
ncbi:BTAD domain-containing putative transcriptional regulator [Streptomyces microflavus]